jgi:hypothetical protein
MSSVPAAHRKPVSHAAAAEIHASRDPVLASLIATAARDAEERAAEVYASLIRRVLHLATSDGDLSGPLAA